VGEEDMTEREQAFLDRGQQLLFDTAKHHKYLQNKRHFHAWVGLEKVGSIKRKRKKIDEKTYPLPLKDADSEKPDVSESTEGKEEARQNHIFQEKCWELLASLMEIHDDGEDMSNFGKKQELLWSECKKRMHLPRNEDYLRFRVALLEILANPDHVVNAQFRVKNRSRHNVPARYRKSQLHELKDIHLTHDLLQSMSDPLNDMIKWLLYLAVCAVHTEDVTERKQFGSLVSRLANEYLDAMVDEKKNSPRDSSRAHTIVLLQALGHQSVLPLPDIVHFLHLEREGMEFTTKRMHIFMSPSFDESLVQTKDLEWRILELILKPMQKMIRDHAHGHTQIRKRVHYIANNLYILCSQREAAGEMEEATHADVAPALRSVLFLLANPQALCSTSLTDMVRLAEFVGKQKMKKVSNPCDGP